MEFFFVCSGSNLGDQKIMKFGLFSTSLAQTLFLPRGTVSSHVTRRLTAWLNSRRIRFNDDMEGTQSPGAKKKSEMKLLDFVVHFISVRSVWLCCCCFVELKRLSRNQFRGEERISLGDGGHVICASTTWNECQNAQLLKYCRAAHSSDDFFFAHSTRVSKHVSSPCVMFGWQSENLLEWEFHVQNWYFVSIYVRQQLHGRTSTRRCMQIMLRERGSPCKAD